MYGHQGPYPSGMPGSPGVFQNNAQAQHKLDPDQMPSPVSNWFSNHSSPIC